VRIEICNKGSEAAGDCLASAGKNQMKRNINCISILAELQPRTNMDGEGYAEQIKRQSETKYKELCQVWKNFRSEGDESKLRF